MPPSDKAHGRTHSLLLLQKLLNLRDGASPLTLVVDSLEQPAWPLIAEFATRARISKAKTILLSFTTVRKPDYIDVLVPTFALTNAADIRTTLLSHFPSPTTSTTTTTTLKKQSAASKVVVFIDSLNALVSLHDNLEIAQFLPSLIEPHTSLVAVYHADVLVLPPTPNEYAPPPLSIVSHMATAVVRTLSLAQELARQRARDRSLPEPEFGLAEQKEGVIIGLCAIEPEDGPDEVRRGIVLDVEIRRRSGRCVGDVFVLLRPAPGGSGVGKMCPKEDYRLFAKKRAGTDDAGADEGPASTFDLGLTDKQRKDRDGVVLPYFDAQTDIGGGEGGRILYDLGREDDFDEEEDEDM